MTDFRCERWSTYIHKCVSVWERWKVCGCVCHWQTEYECVWQREREREREWERERENLSVLQSCLFQGGRGSAYCKICACVRVFVITRVLMCVCVCVWMSGWVTVCVCRCVCERRFVNIRLIFDVVTTPMPWNDSLRPPDQNLNQDSNELPPVIDDLEYNSKLAAPTLNEY